MAKNIILYMDWQIYFSNTAVKQAKNLSIKALSSLEMLIEDLQEMGPIPGKQWHNYGKIYNQKTDLRHCHLNRGKPTYVCCWELVDKLNKIIKIVYVGTHEKAPY